MRIYPLHWLTILSPQRVTVSSEASGPMMPLIAPFFGFLASCSDIYMTHFGMDERQFGFFFGFNALAMMSGPFLFSRLARTFTSWGLLTVSFSGIMTFGILMTCLHHQSPWSLALPMWGISFFLGMSRPPSNNIILEQVDRDAGAASSLIIFTFMTVGAFSMGIISLPWQDKITVLGTLGSVVGVAVLTFWLRYGNRFVPTAGRQRHP